MLKTPPAPPKSDDDAHRRAIGRWMVAIGTFSVVGGLLYAIVKGGIVGGGCAMAFGFVIFVLGRLNQD